MSRIKSVNAEQEEAIYSRGDSILVSAPAGSGKTKILVNRILSLLEDDGYQIDQLLVLTFTNAAALEMKQRLEKSLDDRLKEITDEKKQLHLLEQKRKLPMAYITNFHGFCSTLLKQYGYTIGVASDFEILSDPTLIQHTLLDNCIEEWLLDNRFTKFLSSNFAEYHFNTFKNLLFKLHNLSHTIDNFPQYKENLKINMYDPITQNKPIDTWCISAYIKEELHIKAMEGKNKVIELRNFCAQHGLTFFYENPYLDSKKKDTPTPFDCYLKYFNDIETILETDSLEYCITKGKPTLSKSYNASFNEETREYQKEYNRMKNNIIKGYTSKFEDSIYQDQEEFSTIMQESYACIEYLLLLVERFEIVYQTYKKEHNILDFNDLESYALTLLEPKHQIVDILYHQLKEIMIDEYQDTNQIQESLITKISDYQDPKIPCFMVGDMKQSIYKFRGGDPEIFNDKYLRYTNDIRLSQTKPKRIDLKYNYRSNKIVLDSINYIFNQIMDIEIGGLDYYLDESAKLNYDYLRKEGAKDTSEESFVKEKARLRLSNEQRFTTELLLTPKSKGQDMTSAELEARVVAKRITVMVGHSTLDDYSGKTRPVRYQDIVVLMRSTTEFIAFKKVFDRFQIPNQIILSQGFLNAQEVINSIYVLKAIDNHLDDIAMVSLLKGNYTISHFDENFLVKVRSDVNRSVYDNLTSYVENQQENYEQVENFLDYYHILVTFSKNNTVKDTLTKFYQDSQYMLFVTSLINGKQRYANLELLIEQLENQESLDLHTLVCNYSKYMETGINMAPGQVLTTNNNSVSFMTIHKSKGLEFPIVFVCQLHKQFNKQDSRERMIIDKNLGIAIKPRISSCIEEYQNVIIEYDNKYRKVIASAQTRELINEEMRIFYVALTRASQKLILSGAIDSIQTMIQWQQAIINNEDDDIVRVRSKDKVLLYRNLRNAKSYLEWLGLSIVRHPDIIKQCKTKNIATNIDDETLEILKQNADRIAIYPNKNNHFSNTEHARFSISCIDYDTINEYSFPIVSDTIDTTEQVYQRYANFTYRSENQLEKTMAVTKKIEDGDRIFTSIEYDYEEDATFAASDRGTIIHSVMEHIPLLPNIDVTKVCSDLFASGIYSKEEIELITNYEHHIIDFINSDIYQLLLQSDVVYREKKFSLLDNNQIIHGIFDVVCITDTVISIIDYKTDRISKNTKEEELITLHQPQMEYYKKILQKVFPTSSINAIVYYLHINKSVTL